MNLTTARSFVRSFARNAGDSSMYSDTQVDQAIQAIADDFLRVTRATKQTNDLELTADSAVIGTLPSNFRPERVIQAWIPDKGQLALIDLRTLLQAQIDSPLTALPQFLSFDSWTTGVVYPTPDVDYTAKLFWYPPFTSFTAGTSTDPGTLNLPDDWLRTILIYGATALLQHNEPEHRYASETYQKYLTFRDGLKGAGGLGEKVVYRRLED